MEIAKNDMRKENVSNVRIKYIHFDHQSIFNNKIHDINSRDTLKTMPDVIENCLWRFIKNNDLIQDVCMVIM